MSTGAINIQNGNSTGLRVAVDACRNRSGGARIHLTGIFDDLDPQEFGISEIHLWAHKALADSIPDQPWLTKHVPAALDQSIVQQLWWQARHMRKEITDAGCDICLSTTASSASRFSPVIAMSRDMLSFEKGEMQRYPVLSRQRLRLMVLKHLQIRSLKNADAAVFLTRYAADALQKFTGVLNNVQIIPHGISNTFLNIANSRKPDPTGEDIHCVYVSDTHLYKHQWHVVEAIRKLRDNGVGVKLTLIGNVVGEGGKKLTQAVNEFDRQREFVTLTGPLPHENLVPYLQQAQIFIFASSCENMPNTLLEGMAAGLPIACAKRGPMPEILQGAGLYFDPEDPNSIATSVQQLIDDDSMAINLAQNAHDLAQRYSWKRCARETWSYVATTARRFQ